MSDDVLICSALAPETEDGRERVFNPAWRTEFVVALSKLIVSDFRFDQMPTLADVLEEAGCDDGMVLRHCRECEQHKASCWVLSLTLDRSHPTSHVGELSPEFKQTLQETIVAKQKARTGHSMTVYGYAIDYFWLYAVGAVVNLIIFLFIVAALKKGGPPD